MLTIHRVKEVLGEDVANALYEHFAGQQLNIPKKKCSMMFVNNDERDNFIYNSHFEVGMSYAEIADIVGLEEETVRKLASKKHYER